MNYHNSAEAESKCECGIHTFETLWKIVVDYIADVALGRDTILDD
jgi:hypothetical protein